MELSGESLAAAFTDRLGKPRAVSLGLGLNCLAALALPILGSNTTGAIALQGTGNSNNTAGRGHKAGQDAHSRSLSGPVGT